MTDLSPLRARFPSLSREGPDGRPMVFADAPGGSQVPESVIEAMVAYLRTSNSNTHGLFDTSRETDEVIEAARRAGADITGADPDEIVLGPERDDAPDGPVALVRPHAADPATRSSSRCSTTTRTCGRGSSPPRTPAPPCGGSTSTTTTPRSTSTRSTAPCRIARAWWRSPSPRTRSASIPHAADLARRAHAAGALVAVDGVHLAQHRSLDVRAIDADILACSPYKFFGPHLGMLAVRRDLLAEWRPYKLRPAPDEVPERWETGTQNHEGLAGLAAAVDYLAGVGREFGAPVGGTRRGEVVAAFDAIVAHERELALRFLDGLVRMPRVRLWGIERPGARRRTNADVRDPRRRAAPGRDRREARPPRRSASGTAITTRSP